MPDLISEALNRWPVGISDDFSQCFGRFAFGLAADHERIQGEADFARVASGRCSKIPDFVDLLGYLLRAISIHEIPVRDPSGHVASSFGITALKNLGMRLRDGLRLERCLIDPIEVTFEGESLLGPKASENADEFFRPAIPLVVIEPRLAITCELAPKPAAHDIYSGAAATNHVDC